MEKEPIKVYCEHCGGIHSVDFVKKQVCENVSLNLKDNLFSIGDVNLDIVCHHCSGHLTDSVDLLSKWGSLEDNPKLPDDLQGKYHLAFQKIVSYRLCPDYIDKPDCLHAIEDLYCSVFTKIYWDNTKIEDAGLSLVNNYIAEHCCYRFCNSMLHMEKPEDVIVKFCVAIAKKDALEYIKQEQEGLKNIPTACPRCAEDATMYHLVFSDGAILAKCCCANCGHIWTETYDFKESSEPVKIPNEDFLQYSAWGVHNQRMKAKNTAVEYFKEDFKEPGTELDQKHREQMKKLYKLAYIQHYIDLSKTPWEKEDWDRLADVADGFFGNEWDPDDTQLDAELKAYRAVDACINMASDNAEKDTEE